MINRYIPITWTHQKRYSFLLCLVVDPEKKASQYNQCFWVVLNITLPGYSLFSTTIGILGWGRAEFLGMFSSIHQKWSWSSLTGDSRGKIACQIHPTLDKSAIDPTKNHHVCGWNHHFRSWTNMKRPYFHWPHGATDADAAQYGIQKWPNGNYNGVNKNGQILWMNHCINIMIIIIIHYCCYYCYYCYYCFYYMDNGNN